MSKGIDPRTTVDAPGATSGETNGMRLVKYRTSKIESCAVSDATPVMSVYGKAVTAEHLAAVLDYLRRIGAVRQYQLAGFLHQFHGFTSANGQAQEAAGRILQRLKKQGLVRYTICGWMPRQ